ncbi:zeta toxin family protein [Nocardioides sp. Bht2]|uniref:zeta toxin family protein n=1 Tax=Nocardioides sp. Bht2 TaxID=3392297 RepID=UPI0039B51632
MTSPVLHLLAGSNGSGKSTFAEHVLLPTTHLPFVNADLIAEEIWPDDREAQALGALEVSRLAAKRREFLLRRGTSFVTETVFSHPSKVSVVQHAQVLGYAVTLHVIVVPEELAVARVADRVRAGGHQVPEQKIRDRYRRLFPLVAQALRSADSGVVYDNSSLDEPFRRIARYRYGQIVGEPVWPIWAPETLRLMGP